MTQSQTPAGEEPLKAHGEKLSGAAGDRVAPAEPAAIAPAEESLKEHGDKLQAAVDKAAG